MYTMKAYINLMKAYQVKYVKAIATSAMREASNSSEVIAMVKKLRESGTRIDGIGIQAHWSIKNIPLQDIEASIIAYSALGLKVSFTELDLTCLPNPWDLTGSDVNQNYENSPFMNPYPSGLPDSMQAKLTKSYEDLFRLFVRYKDRIERVTFWGVNDGQSWLNNWPVRGRTNYPLLFDRQFKNKAGPAGRIVDPNAAAVCLDYPRCDG